MTACIVAGRAARLPDQGQQIFNERSLITAPFVGKGCLEVNEALCTEVFHTHPPFILKTRRAGAVSSRVPRSWGMPSSEFGAVAL